MEHHSSVDRASANTSVVHHVQCWLTEAHCFARLWHQYSQLCRQIRPQEVLKHFRVQAQRALLSGPLDTMSALLLL